MKSIQMNTELDSGKYNETTNGESINGIETTTTTQNYQSTNEPPTTSLSSSNGQEDLPMISREKWNATSPKREFTNLKKLPVPFAIIDHTETAFCETFVWCSYQAQFYQKTCMNRGKNDVDFNFLIGGDGYVYDCRGWNHEGEHTYGYNDKSIGIGFIGDFRIDYPTNEQLEATMELLDVAVRENKLARYYKLVTLNSAIKPIINKWDHWAPELSHLTSPRKLGL